MAASVATAQHLLREALQGSPQPGGAPRQHPLLRRQRARGPPAPGVRQPRVRFRVQLRRGVYVRRRVWLRCRLPAAICLFGGGGPAAGRL
jgi:hypothetical protein